MEINGVTSQITSILQTEIVPKTEPEEQEPIQEQPPSNEIPESNATEPNGSDDESIKGVIRNLLDGHYKGVSDVRLRIVHHEELEAMQGEQLKATVEREVAGLLSAVEDGISEILETSETVATEAISESESKAELNSETVTVSGLHNEFIDVVNGLTQEFLSEETPSTDNLISGIENAFADFIASLQDLLVPLVEESLYVEEENAQASESSGSEPPVSETLSEEETTPLAPTGPDFQNLINELSSTFTAAIDELTESLNTVQILPELSEPSGNGIAYEKFLEIYNNLWSIQSFNEEPVSDESLDIVT